MQNHPAMHHATPHDLQERQTPMTTLPPPLADLNALPPMLDLVTAGRLLGIGRTTAYKLAQSGTFPVPVLRIGSGYKVPSAPLHALLTNPSPTPPRRAARAR